MLPSDADFARMERQWEAEQDRRMDEWIDSHDAPDMEDDDDERTK